MNLKYFKNSTASILTILILLLSASTLVFADKSDRKHGGSHGKHGDSHERNTKGELVKPDGFDKLVLYMGNGIFEPGASEPRPGVSCVGLFCDGHFFQEEIMNRTSDEVMALRETARLHFIEFFGIDADDPAMADRISFDLFMVNPDFQYRVHALSEENIPSEGWVIRDGGYSITVTDPAGVALGGESTGLHAGQGAGGFFGNYNILTTDKHGNADGELIIHYASQTPTVPLANGDFYFKCAMFNEDWGDGIGMGIMNFIPLDDGRVRGNVRNTLTFAPSSTVMDFPATPAFDEAP